VKSYKQYVGAVDLPFAAPTQFPGERSPHSFPENRAHNSAQTNWLSGGSSTMCPSSGEDGNLTAYYHGEKKRPCYPNLNHYNRAAFYRPLPLRCSSLKLIPKC